MSSPHKEASKAPLLKSTISFDVENTTHHTEDVQTYAWKKYSKYHVEVDPDQDDKSKDIDVFSLKRPHMRAFHCSSFCFFVAFFIWFAINPLLPRIRSDLNIAKQDLWTASIAGVSGTILVRFIVGPLCDTIGPRILFSVMMCAAAIPTACTGFIQNGHDLITLRFFIGIAGGTFVTCQYWTSRMFTKEMVGTANALVGGWGNLGASVSQLTMSRAIIPLMDYILDGDTEMSWRVSCIIPAVFGFAVGIGVLFVSDDTPKGNYSERKLNGNFQCTTAKRSCCYTSKNINSWILFVQYACCFGVELTMYNAATMYFEDEFGLSTVSAATSASVFGWMNLFARGFGGIFSDVANFKWGMRGRLYMQTICLLAEGLLVVVFAHTTSLAGSVCTLLFFSLFVQAAEGTSFAIVPYIDPLHMGSVCGIAGAGGNVGAMCFTLGFRQLSYYKAFMIMGGSVIFSSFLSYGIHIKGYASMLSGTDLPINKETGELLLKQGPRMKKSIEDC